MNIDHGLVIIKYKFIPIHIIDTLAQLAQAEAIPAPILSADGNQKPNQSYRDTNSHKIPDAISFNIIQTTKQIHDQFLKTTYNSTLKNVEPPQLLSYGVGGKYDEHNDSEDWVNGKLQQIVPRDITMIWYLNDDYIGGELEFTQFQLTFKPKSGDMIAFPSYYEFAHRVHSVTSGKRCALVTWLQTEKRIYERAL